LSNQADHAANERHEGDWRMTLEGLSGLVAHYGYLVVFASALVGSAGIPLPATELLIAAAIYAAHTHRLDVAVLAGGAAMMAVIGGLVGYAVGKSVGVVALARHGSAIGLRPARLRLGQYLFLAHGGKIVFFIRFIAFLGPFGGLLAGVNRMRFSRFALFNALGSVTWAICVSAGGYVFGTFFASVGQPIGLAALIVAAALAIAAFVYIHQRGASLQAKADAALHFENAGG
jgi:membrane protein DedA with SNARE-associated domain